jgi:hypothetical protein
MEAIGADDDIPPLHAPIGEADGDPGAAHQHVVQQAVGPAPQHEMLDLLGEQVHPRARQRQLGGQPPAAHHQRGQDRHRHDQEVAQLHGRPHDHQRHTRQVVDQPERTRLHS